MCFIGPDFGLKKHYIDQINKVAYKNRLMLLDNYEKYTKSQSGGSLLKLNNVYVIPEDTLFLDIKKKDYISKYISRIIGDTLIFDYELEYPNKTLFKEFENYITYFPLVQDKIAYQFVDSEITLNQSSKEELARNCSNNYGTILLECDKIKNYAQAKNINHQTAWEDLTISNQLIYRYPEFHSYELMNDILKGNFKELSYWSKVINDNFLDDFWIALESIANDYLIAYYIKRYGRINGSTKAYEAGFYWRRIKQIREYNIPYTFEALLNKARKVSNLDAKIKFGTIPKEELFDYFLCLIV